MFAVKSSEKYKKIIDTSGKCLFVWFIYQSYSYIFRGFLIREIGQVSTWFKYNFLSGVYSVCQIPIATCGAFILIPLLLRGNVWGLYFGIAYWLFGNSINPIWFFIPLDLRITPDGDATALLWVVNILWAAIVIAIIACFYSQRKTHE